MALISDDLIEMASHSDTDEAEILLEAIENEESARKILKKARDFIKVLLEADIIEKDQVEDLLSPTEEEKPRKRKDDDYILPEDDEDDDFSTGSLDDNDDDDSSDETNDDD